MGEIFLIYARAANGTIGKDGGIPWHISQDMKRFRALTMGKPMIMGRKTFESFGKPLPGRRHIVLTRRDSWNSEGAEVARSVEQALAIAREGNGDGDIAVVGGSAVYDVYRPLADRIELTEIHAEYEGDTFMKPLGAPWECVAREDHDASGDRPAYSFLTYRRHDRDRAA